MPSSGCFLLHPLLGYASMHSTWQWSFQQQNHFLHQKWRHDHLWSPDTLPPTSTVWSFAGKGLLWGCQGPLLKLEKVLVFKKSCTKVCTIHTKWYMGSRRRRYKISLWVINLILKYWVEQKKRNFISPSDHVLFCLFYKHTNNEDFCRFSEDFWSFFEDFQRSSECCAKAIRTLAKISRQFSKITEDFWSMLEDLRGRSKDVLTIHQQIYVRGSNMISNIIKSSTSPQ